MTKVTKKKAVSTAKRARSAASEAGARERNKLDKRDRITAAAWEVFSREGFEASSTNAIAERAGVAKGTLFLYAADKEDLLLLVMHDRLARATDDAFATIASKAPIDEQIAHVFGALYELYLSQPRGLGTAFVRAVATSRGPNADRVQALTQALLSRLSALVRDACERGELVDAPAMPAAFNLFAAYFMVLFGWLSGLSNTVAEMRASVHGLVVLQLRAYKPR